jgi:flagellar basal-body rod protein FlgC
MAIESVFSSFGVSVSGLTAQRRKLDAVASNIANAYTTRTPEGGPYRRKDVSFEEQTFDDYLYRGVNAVDSVEDNADAVKVFDPSHPDADKDGYVAYPNVRVVDEMVSMVAASRAYEANVQVFQASKAMITKSFDLLV